ncbi:MAG: EAL domain-containing protein [Gammaproteobacteria bacterium]|nr:EAL domain-containing protein [Gammaproteobacteria bacterium]
MGLLRQLNKLSFRRQIAWAFALGIVLVYLSSSIAISLGSVRAVRLAMLEDGRQIAENFANQSVLALLYHSGENVKDAAEATLGFPDVRSVSIYTREGELLATFGDSAADIRPLTSPPDSVTLHDDSPDFFSYTAPVSYGGQLQSSATEAPTHANTPEVLGYVHVVVGKDRLTLLTRSVFGFNFIMSVVVAGLLLLALLKLTKSVTHPINALSQLMRRAESGETGMRAKEAGPCDVREMQQSFNTMIGVIEDRNRDLAESRDAALEVARLKGEFAANVSHELRTPLNGVLGMLELLRVSRSLAATDRKYADIAFASGNSLLELINDILDFSKVETGHLRLHFEDFYLPTIIGDVIRIIADQARRKHLEISHEIAADVPLALRGDVTRLRQILLNLVANAVKFTEAGSVIIRICRENSTDAGLTIRFEVIDTGIGLKLHAQGRIFDAFQQADGSTTRRYGGTGLGLAICRQLVTLMGGRIGVMSFPRQGSTFWFAMPIGRAEDNSVIPDRTLAAGIRVLAISQAERQVVFLKQTFQHWHAYFRSAATVDQAQLLLDEAETAGRAYDVVIVDLPPGQPQDALISFLKSALETGKNTCLAIGANTDIAGLPAANLGLLNRPLSEGALYEGLVRSLQQKSRRGTSAQPLTGLPRFSGAVLVVEDDIPNQMVTRSMLESFGLQVVIAGNGREALYILQENKFDLVLMDCQMPEMDGYEATVCIRALTNDVATLPILAMTANASTEDRDKCLAVGMDGHISKPLRLHTLAEKLRPWLVLSDANITQSPALPEPAADVIDHSAFDEIRAHLGITFDEYLSVFQQDMQRYIDTLYKQADSKDLLAITTTAHTIKGSASTIGATGIARIAYSIERDVREGRTEGLIETIDSMQQSFEAFTQAISLHIATIPIHGMQPSVLIVDEDAGTRLALRKIMESDDCIVTEADNGADAVEICSQSMPDIILMDAVMPAMDGFTACARIKALHGSAATSILMITALDNATAIENALAAGATDYIPRPINLTLLRKRVGRLLNAHRSEKERWHLAYVDELTGLSNRLAFRESLTALLTTAEEHSAELAVLFLDLDRFKIANDSLGHDIGDLLIRAVAARIVQSLPAEDMVARLGGDEFGIVLKNPTGRDMVAKTAGRLCEALAEPFTFLEKEVYLGASIGIAMYPKDGATLGELIKNADTAMYQSKADKGGHYSFYRRDMAYAVEARLDIERDLRHALDRDQFELHYQPQVDSTTGAVIGLEALIRWHHPERGMVSPLDFIPVAEETGLIISIGQWVLVQACATAAKIQRNHKLNIKMAVNICGRQLLQPGFLESVHAALKNSGLPPTSLELEITESSLIENFNAVVAVTREIKDAGISLSVDDFGTGYSSLSYLSRLPIDLVKIDRAFVRDLPGDLVNANLVKAIIAMTSNLGMDVLAEGVETQDQVKALRDMDCSLMQGFLYSRPLPYLQLTQWLSGHKNDNPTKQFQQTGNKSH